MISFTTAGQTNNLVSVPETLASAKKTFSTLRSGIEPLFPLEFYPSVHDDVDYGYVHQLNDESNQAHDKESHANANADTLELPTIWFCAALVEPQRVLIESFGRNH